MRHTHPLLHGEHATHIHTHSREHAHTWRHTFTHCEDIQLDKRGQPCSCPSPDIQCRAKADSNFRGKAPRPFQAPGPLQPAKGPCHPYMGPRQTCCFTLHTGHSHTIHTVHGDTCRCTMTHTLPRGHKDAQSGRPTPCTESTHHNTCTAHSPCSL